MTTSHSDSIVIMGALVDVRNIGVHKSVKLTIHVPEELAPRVVRDFGWPTGVNPVAVAIARLDLNHQPAKEVAAPTTNKYPAPPNPARASPAAISCFQLCKQPSFQIFLAQTRPDKWRLLNEGTKEEKAALLVKEHCGVNKRTEIAYGEPSYERWQKLQDQYQRWQDR